MPIDSAEADILARLRPYAHENLGRTWSLTLSTFAAIGLAETAAAALPSLGLRLAASVLAGLLVVRAFSFFHDAMHGAIFRRSRVGRALMSAFGFLVLTPPRAWRESHNYHHAHNGQLVGSQIGSYPLMTTAMWETATPWQRARYRFARHPLGIVFGYVTAFAYGMCLAPFFRAPRKNWGGPLALVLHAGLLALASRAAGPSAALTLVVLPILVATAMGSYLFYAQHNYPAVRVRNRRDWTYTSAALEASSYMETGPVWAWLTGNIGVHHVHHCNPHVPCYRLYEAMAAVPELAIEPNNTMHPRDIAACFRLNLLDTGAARMVPYPNGADL
jgi:omega-6 fatty acid desaturase (delta-12 desaturase)